MGYNRSAELERYLVTGSTLSSYLESVPQGVQRVMSTALDLDVPKKAKRSAPKSAPVDRKAMAIQIRGSDEWKAWAEELAESERDTLAKLVDRLFTKFAAEKGFRPPPKR
jgi:hypothetical protein